MEYGLATWARNNRKTFVEALAMLILFLRQLLLVFLVQLSMMELFQCEASNLVVLCSSFLAPFRNQILLKKRKKFVSLKFLIIGKSFKEKNA